jgi:hypothetical protein
VLTRRGAWAHRSGGRFDDAEIRALLEAGL